ncbi:hypothetical protein PENSPDRAFT_735057 [Peniophora sp. CONT]|nr:hypothetical protein PENSPDRAFT_735057 [Peniophora sp. CONT]
MVNASPTQDEANYSDFYVWATLHFRTATSVISGVFDEEFALKNALRAIRWAWNSIPAGSRPSLDDFTKTCFLAMPPVSEPGLPAHLVSFIAHPGIQYFDAPLYYGHRTGRQYYIIDGPVPTHYRAIPFTLYTPYADPENPGRSSAIQDRVSPIPILFFQEGGSLGFPIEASADCKAVVRLLGGDHKLVNLETKSSLTVRFGWQDYPADECRIRGTEGSPLNNVSRLAMLTAGAVRNFMARISENRPVYGAAPPQWRIGTRDGEINVRNVLLLGVLFVSEGSVMPLLATCV